MSRVILLQTSLSRDVGDDDALIATAASLTRSAATSNIALDVLAATDEPARTSTVTGLPSISAAATAVRRHWDRSSTLVMLGGTVGAAKGSTTLSITELSALALWAQASGRRLALVGVRVEPVTHRSTHRLLRTVVHSAALTIAADAESADVLLAAGVPAPIRVGSHPWWLGLSGPRTVTDTRRGIWCVVGDLELASLGGAEHIGRLIARLVPTDAPTGTEVVVQAWRRGRFSGADLVAAAEIEAILSERQIPVRLAGPPRTLAEQRDAVTGAALVVATNPRAQAAAFCAGVPVVSWRPVDHAVSRSLGIDSLLASGTGSDGQPVLPGHAPDGAAATVAAGREADAAAVLELLSVLITGGRSALEPHPPPGSVAALQLPAAGQDPLPTLPQPRSLRPLGVLR